MGGKLLPSFKVLKAVHDTSTKVIKGEGNEKREPSAIKAHELFKAALIH